MAQTLNRWQGIGNLGKDPEARTTQSGKRIVNLSVACSDTWKKDGQKQQSTFWAAVVIFNEKLGEVAEKWLRKGSKVYIEGKLVTRKWTDQNGVDRYSTEVVIDFSGTFQMLGEVSEGGQSSQQSQRQNKPQSNPQPQNSGYGTQSGGWGDPSDLDDEIPF